MKRPSDYTRKRIAYTFIFPKKITIGWEEHPTTDDETDALISPS